MVAVPTAFVAILAKAHTMVPTLTMAVVMAVGVTVVPRSQAMAMMHVKVPGPMVAACLGANTKENCSPKEEGCEGRMAMHYHSPSRLH